MKKKLPATIFVITVFCIVTVGTALAQDRVTGVPAGNEFTYSQRSLWVSSDPNAPMPSGLADINVTDY